MIDRTRAPIRPPGISPLCIACGNTRRFHVRTAGREREVDLAEIPVADESIVACGRCRSRALVVFTERSA